MAFQLAPQHSLHIDRDRIVTIRRSGHTADQSIDKLAASRRQLFGSQISIHRIEIELFRSAHSSLACRWAITL